MTKFFSIKATLLSNFSKKNGGGSGIPNQLLSFTGQSNHSTPIVSKPLRIAIITFVAIILFFNATMTTAIGICEAEPEAQIQRFYYLPNVNSSEKFTPRKTRYISKVISSDTLIDVRSPTDIQKQPIADTIIIPAFSIKTRNYLKNKRLILVGDGLDYFLLEKVVSELEKARFKSVKILQHGVNALLTNNKEKPYSLKPWQLVNSNKIIPASIQQLDDYLYVNLNESSLIYQTMNLKYIDRPFKNSHKYIADLASFITDSLAHNQNTRIVLVHEDLDVYRTLLSSTQADIFSNLNIWYLKGGNQSLERYHQQLVTKLSTANKVKRTCLH